MEHDLKTWPGTFECLRKGFKNFEFRKDDRGFDLGDVLNLREWNPASEEYSGKSEKRRVGYIIRNSFGIPEGYCIMSWDLDPSLRAELDRTKAELSGECKIKVGIVENVWNCKQDCDW